MNFSLSASIGIYVFALGAAIALVIWGILKMIGKISPSTKKPIEKGTQQSIYFVSILFIVIGFVWLIFWLQQHGAARFG